MRLISFSLLPAVPAQAQIRHISVDSTDIHPSKDSCEASISAGGSMIACPLKASNPIDIATNGEEP